MKKTLKNDESGAVLFILTMCMMLLVNVTAVSYLYASKTRAKMVNKHIDIEKAVYIAETGVERSVAYLMAGGTETNLTGSLNGGTYIVTIIEKTSN